MVRERRANRLPNIHRLSPPDAKWSADLALLASELSPYSPYRHRAASTSHLNHIASSISPSSDAVILSIALGVLDLGLSAENGLGEIGYWW